MRSLNPTRSLRSLLSEERGASLALVALSLVWIVGLASLVVDIGGGWLSRQTLISATDAAALAAAQDLVDRPGDAGGACNTAETYVAGNAPAAVVTDCAVTPFGANGGLVTVTAGAQFEPVFTDLTTDESVQSVSTATWGPPLTVSGLRPFALCYDGSSALRHLVDNPPSGPTWIRISYTKDVPSDCGGATSAGNFATVDFDGGTPITEIRDWMLNGHPGQIEFDPSTVIDCEGAAVCYQRPYASNDIRWEMQTLIYNQTYVAFPLFNYSNVDEVHLIGVVRARLYAFMLDGPPEDWWIELKVDPGLITGTCCGPPAVLSGNQVIAICGVDPGAYQACEPDDGS